MNSVENIEYVSTSQSKPCKCQALKSYTECSKGNNNVNNNHCTSLVLSMMWLFIIKYSVSIT